MLHERHNAVVCTDYELFFLMNDRLPQEARISYRSFQRYKAEALKGLHDVRPPLPDDVPADMEVTMVDMDAPTNKEPVGEDRKELLEQLHTTWMKAVVQQKNNLMDLVVEANTGWQRFKWILERKFRDWHPDYEFDNIDEIVERKIRWMLRFGGPDRTECIRLPEGDEYYNKNYVFEQLSAGKSIEEI